MHHANLKALGKPFAAFEIAGEDTAGKPMFRLIGNPERVVFPAGSYKGIDRDTPSVGSWSFVFARTDLPDETAHRLARALHRAEGRLGARLPQARESTAANTWSAVADPTLLHPGVRRYLREANIGR